MSQYKHYTMPNYTTNDMYGSFYDQGKVSLITIPQRLKNYDLDVRKTQVPTSYSEYGEFLRSNQVRPGDWYMSPDFKPAVAVGRSTDQYVSGETLSHRISPPPPVDKTMYQYMQKHPILPSDYTSTLDKMQDWPENVHSQGYGYDRDKDSPRHYDDLSRSVDPPNDRYQSLGKLNLSSRNPPPPVRHTDYMRDSSPEPSPRQHRSNSPVPPLDPREYKSHLPVYTGGSPAPFNQPPKSVPAPVVSSRTETSNRDVKSPQPQYSVPITFGNKEVRLPEVDAVELHMRDRSKILLNVKEFYNRYLRE